MKVLMDNYLRPVKTLHIEDQELAKRYIRLMLHKFSNIIISNEKADDGKEQIVIYSPMSQTA